MTPITEAFEATLRAEFEAWATERGHPLCDVIPKYGPASSMSATTLRFSDIAWEAYRAATERAAKLVEACPPPLKNEGGRVEIGERARGAFAAAIRASSGMGASDE
jgi:hypothetical protein